MRNEMRKIKLKKIVVSLLHKLRKLYMKGTVIQKFKAFLKLWKILSNFCFAEQIFYRKQSLDSPDKFVLKVTKQRRRLPFFYELNLAVPQIA